MTVSPISPVKLLFSYKIKSTENIYYLKENRKVIKGGKVFDIFTAVVITIFSIITDHDFSVTVEAVKDITILSIFYSLV